MNKMKLHAKLIDLGVVEEEQDTVIIKESQPIGELKSTYIIVISGLGNVATYIFHNNKLVMIEGNNIHVSDIDKLKKLDLEEFE